MSSRQNMQDSMASVTLGQYEDLEAEYKACQQQLRSKDEALKIFQEQLRNSDINNQKLQQEINQLRSQLARSHPVFSTGTSATSSSSVSVVNHDLREKYISQLEESQEKISEYERQIQQLEDEKEEVISERDYYSGKCDSLLKCLNEERSAQKPSHSTIQSLVEENHKLKMELVEAQAERDHAFSRIERYKKAIERQRAIEMAANQGLEGGDKKQDLRQTMKRVKELEGLANSLSGSVKEKSLALTHQKKANKMLGKRIAELEHRLKVLEISGLWSNPDSLLPKVDQPPLSPEIITSSEVSDTHTTTTNTDTDDRTLGEEVSETCPPKSNSSIIKESPGHSTIVNLA